MMEKEEQKEVRMVVEENQPESKLQNLYSIHTFLPFADDKFAEEEDLLNFEKNLGTENEICMSSEWFGGIYKLTGISVSVLVEGTTSFWTNKDCYSFRMEDNPNLRVFDPEEVDDIKIIKTSKDVEEYVLSKGGYDEKWVKPKRIVAIVLTLSPIYQNLRDVNQERDKWAKIAHKKSLPLIILRKNNIKRRDFVVES